MAFTILENSTTAEAEICNDNFYHVAQGSRMPRGGTSLSETDSAYDLGSSAATWNNLFCEKIYANEIISSGDKIWTLIAETTLTTTATSIEFTGLNGDDALEYRIVFYSEKVAPLNVFIHPNSDTTSSYPFHHIYAIDTNIYANYYQTTGAGSMRIYANGGSLCDFFLTTKTGMGRKALTSYLSMPSTTIDALYLQGNLWDNSTDTITSLKFRGEPYFDINTAITLWKKG